MVAVHALAGEAAVADGGRLAYGFGLTGRHSIKQV